MPPSRLLFSCPELAHLAEALLTTCPGLKHGAYTTDRFLNGELSVLVRTPVERAECVVLASLTPPAERCLGTLLLVDTLHRYGATTIDLVLPYFAYARHDRGGGGRSIAFPLLHRLCQTAGAARILTIDLHNTGATLRGGIPLESLSPSRLFAAALAQSSPREASFVAPDRGATVRADSVRRAAGNELPLLRGEKHRHGATVKTVFAGQPRPHCIIVDDILDTGGTLLEAIDQLRLAGAARFTVCVSHGLFTSTRWEGLWARGVERLVILDTVDRRLVPRDRRIEIRSVAPLLGAALRGDETGSKATPPPEAGLPAPS